MAPPLEIFSFCLVSAYKGWQLERPEHKERPISHPAAEQEKKKELNRGGGVGSLSAQLLVFE